MTALCDEHQISRRTGYKWLARYEAEGPAGLQDRSRRPWRSPQATDPAVLAVFARLRHQYPQWGARKLLRIATRLGLVRTTDLPARTTVCEFLAAQGLVRQRTRPQRLRPATREPFAPIEAPNDLWTVDFKGEFRLGNRRLCYPLTLRDAFSRYVLRCDALPGCFFADTKRQLARAFANFGLPRRIRSDNGTPFASPGLGGLSKLSVWWLRLGIRPELTAPGHPEQNGAHEQFHAVLKAHTTRPPAFHAAAQQHRFRRFCLEYNTVRPHDALADDVPADHYVASPRPLPAQLPALEYPGHFEVRRVTTVGAISWRARQLFIASPLAGEHVAFEEIDTGLWTLWFGTTSLARYCERTHTLQPLVPWRRGRDAAARPRA